MACSGHEEVSLRAFAGSARGHVAASSETKHKVQKSPKAGPGAGGSRRGGAARTPHPGPLAAGRTAPSLPHDAAGQERRGQQSLCPRQPGDVTSRAALGGVIVCKARGVRHCAGNYVNMRSISSCSR